MLYCERFIVSRAFGGRQCSSIVGIVLRQLLLERS